MPPGPIEACEDGSMPSFTQQGGGPWVERCPDAAAGFPAGLVVLVVLALVAGLALTVWKVSTARRMARSAGMDVGDATAMTLLSEEGFEATYLASNLRGTPGAPGQAAPATPTAESRLRELAALRDQGLISDDEYATRRQAIIDAL